MKLQYEIAFQFLLCGLEAFTRRDCGLVLTGLRQTRSDRRLQELLDRWQNRQWIQREGRGRNARYRITAKGIKQVRVSDPVLAWDRPWDGKWRAFSFDLPAPRRKERMLLWRSLRAQKLGLLQRSVWVWPHEVESLLRTIIEADGIPECFCGFRTDSLFLCNDTEVVAASWDWEEINRRHTTYLQHLVATPESLNAARDLRELARIVRIEREACDFAFSLDPLLPRVLWLKDYKGADVDARHRRFQARLRQRVAAVTR